MHKGLLLILLVATSLTSNAQEKRPFPDSLFGVKLGAIYSPGTADLDVGTFPVKEFKGAQQFLGSGLNFYFRPRQENEAFKYVERRKKPDDKYFETSFRLYALPVFPKNVLKLKELPPDLIKWEVVTIEWSSEPQKKDYHYFSAIDFCKSFEIDLGRKPGVYDSYERKTYSCTFKEGEQELSISTLGDILYVRLAYSQPVFEKKDAAVEAVRRKRGMDVIRPY